MNVTQIRTVSLRAYNYLKERANQPIHYTDVAEALRWDPQSVSTALGRMVRYHPEFGVRRVERADEGGSRTGIYIYRPQLVGQDLADYAENGSKEISQKRIVELVEPQASLPEPEPVKDSPNVYEQIGMTRDGKLIVRDEDGVLYQLTDL